MCAAGPASRQWEPSVARVVPCRRRVSLPPPLPHAHTHPHLTLTIPPSHSPFTSPIPLTTLTIFPSHSVTHEPQHPPTRTPTPPPPAVCRARPAPHVRLRGPPPAGHVLQVGMHMASLSQQRMRMPPATRHPTPRCLAEALGARCMPGRTTNCSSRRPAASSPPPPQQPPPSPLPLQPKQPPPPTTCPRIVPPATPPPAAVVLGSGCSVHASAEASRGAGWEGRGRRPRMWTPGQVWDCTRAGFRQWTRP